MLHDLIAFEVISAFGAWLHSCKLTNGKCLTLVAGAAATYLLPRRRLATLWRRASVSEAQRRAPPAADPCSRVIVSGGPLAIDSACMPPVTRIFQCLTVATCILPQ